MIKKILTFILSSLKTGTLMQSLIALIDARMELVKTEIKNKISEAVAKAFVVVAVLFFVSMFLIFISVGIAEYINLRVNSTFIGFMVIAAFYFLIFIFMLLFRKNIEKYLKKKL